jgi:CHAT domain-containing protein
MGAQVTLDWIASQLSDAGHARLVHLACHAAFDARRPERSGLELAPLNGAVAERPRYLPDTLRAPLVDRATLSELLQVDWHGALVVVSACSSGRYRVGAGEEFAGLPRTLLARGARALVMSLWEVDDMATAVLMSNFYDAWERHGGKPEHAGLALSEAQCRMRDMTAADLVRFGCAVGAAAVETHDARLLRAACRAISGAHQVAGHLDHADLWRPADPGSGEPVQDKTFADGFEDQPRIARAPEYATAPFADPIYWAAFVVFGA